jgi:diguanylate cyclase (GGDEF)-like protein
VQWVRDVLSDPDYVRNVSATGTPVLRSEIVALIHHGDHLLGALNVESERADAFDDEDTALIRSLADVIALALANARLFEDAKREIAERKRTEEALRHLSTHDALTGVFNRGFFEAEMERLEHGRDFPVSVIVLDLDNMKKTNDMLGHAAGDALLKSAVRVLQETFRAAELVARTGGDEFAVLLPQTDAAAVKRILARIRAKLKDLNIKNPDLPVELSFGASTAKKGNLSKAYLIADRRMYANKARRKSKRK